MGIVLQETYSSAESSRYKHTTAGGDNIAGLSPFQTLLKKHGHADDIHVVQQCELATGYPGTLAGQQLTYTTGAATAFYVPVHGMQVFCHALKRRLKPGTVQCNALVLNIDRNTRGYIVRYQKRTSANLQVKLITTKSVVLACMPCCWPVTNFEPQLWPLKQAVGTVALCHVYVKTTTRLPPMHRILKGKLGQLVSVRPQLLMVYLSGDIAKYHMNLRTHHKQAWCRELFSMLRQALPDTRFSNKQSPRFYYWDKAVSYWQPNAAGRALVKECVVPHPIKLPNLYSIGEHCSDFQGWAEGAIQTADLALACMLSGKRLHARFTKKHKDTLIYDGRVIDIKQWLRKHPGGLAPLKNHMQDEDVLPIFQAVHHHAPYALAHLLSQQIGFQSGFHVKPCEKSAEK